MPFLLFPLTSHFPGDFDLASCGFANGGAFQECRSHSWHAVTTYSAPRENPGCHRVTTPSQHRAVWLEMGPAHGSQPEDDGKPPPEGAQSPLAVNRSCGPRSTSSGRGASVGRSRREASGAGKQELAGGLEEPQCPGVRVCRKAGLRPRSSPPLGAAHCLPESDRSY